MQIHKASSSLISLNVRLFIMGMMFLVILGGLSLFFIHQYHLGKAEQQHFEKQRLLLNERIDKKVKILQASTLLLANNTIIREALIYEDRAMLIPEMINLREQFGYWTGFVNYAFHVITYDGRSLYRNYDSDNYGQDTSQHPMMVKAMADLKQTHSMIGKGGYNNNYRIINSQPVFAKDDATQLAGFMTVSQGLKQIVMEFEADGFDYYVFERELGEDGALTGDFVVDGASYFADRPFSDWRFKASVFNHGQLQLRDGWYYQTHPIYDHQQQLRAVHVIFAPENQICDQAWSQTERVLWILILVILVLFFSGLAQLLLLKRSVIKPMQRMTSSLKAIIDTERYDQTVPVEREDEVGKVTQLFNTMLLKTDKLIFELNYQKMAIDKSLIISRADPFGTITDVNDNFCKISGFRRDELLGQPHRIVRHPAMDSAVFKEMWQTIQSKQVWQGEVQNRRKDGSSYYVMSYIIPILNRQGEIQEYLSIREDITLIVELREGLQQALAQAEQDKHLAEQANKAKSEFLASMSHELRTPLNAIIGYAQLLELAKLEPKSFKQVHTILVSSKHLLALINDILDFAKLESGKVQFNFETLPVKDLVTDAIELSQNQAKEQGIRLEVSALSSDVRIEVDRLRIKQVLLNLLSNAIKYNTPQGQVYISCQQIKKDEQAYWQLDIRDTGVGISDDNLDKLFEPFNRLGHEGSIIQGTGIGLSITKDLVEQMRGWIEVNSVQGEGTTFSLFFPVADGERSKHSDPNALYLEQDHGSSGNGYKLLYIGRNAVAIQALFELSEQYEALELKIAPSAQNGLDQAAQFAPDLVMLDSDLEEYTLLIEQFASLQIKTQMSDVTQLDLLRERLQALRSSITNPRLDK